MAPPNRKDAGKNWGALKTEISKTQVVKSDGGILYGKSNKIIITAGGTRLSKNKRKDQRKTILNEAARLLKDDGEATDEIPKTLDGKAANLIQSATSTIKALANAGVVGLDCEYVGTGFQGADDQLARVSIVDEKGETLYDKYVKPMEIVTDYRTHVSGVQPGHLLKGTAFAQVQQEVSHMLQNKIVVGHALQNDFRVLKLSHPFRLTRDTSKYKPFRAAVNSGGAPALKLLAERLLGVRIQSGEHSSVVDARTALRLYMLHRKKWDTMIKQAKRHHT